MIPGPENRLMDAILLYAEQEVHYRINNPVGSRNDRQASELKKQYYTDLQKHFSRKLNKPEKATRRFLKNELRKLLVQTNPNLINILLNGRISRWLRNFITGNRRTVNLHQNAIRHLQNQIGQERNLAHLTHAIKQAGFRQDISTVLKKMIAQGLNSFHIRYHDIRHPDTDYVLHFNKIQGTDSYQFERFDVAARPKSTTALHPQPVSWQSFSQAAEIQFSASEAAHLVNGRHICRNGNEWLMLDRTDTLHPIKTQTFNLENALKKLPMKEMNKTEYSNLVKTLKAGGSKEVTLNINGTEEKYRIQPAPGLQAIHVFDINNNRQVDMKKITSKQYEKVAKIVERSRDVVEMEFGKKNKMR
ncbi:hypothetical protein [Chitinophaga cymbidii]|uniref:Uncharacterized protein n=1 Tax=Chitinophaga cymbidii TaxID=1096750 RepID=A0A512RPR4_9BACT|nr:hypothetical protein [Chitinophaga cymbidii]GEP97688.1 hypothetical protein CCY01nite_39480 [Chitinophaga cymbidii]